MSEYANNIHIFINTNKWSERKGYYHIYLLGVTEHSQMYNQSIIKDGQSGSSKHVIQYIPKPSLSYISVTNKSFT
jgi:hypothetical protein